MKKKEKEDIAVGIAENFPSMTRTAWSVYEVNRVGESKFIQHGYQDEIILLPPGQYFISDRTTDDHGYLFFCGKTGVSVVTDKSSVMLFTFHGHQSPPESVIADIVNRVEVVAGEWDITVNVDIVENSPVFIPQVMALYLISILNESDDDMSHVVAKVLSDKLLP